MYAFRYCPDCGGPLPLISATDERLNQQTCPACGAVHFKNAKPCAGALVVQDGKVLLGRRAIEPGRGQWDIPGGFLESWEHPADAAVREVAEETGLFVRLTRLLAVVLDTYQGQFYTLNLYYLAEVAGGIQHAADDLAELHWFGADEIPDELAFTHCAGVLATWKAAVQGTDGSSAALFA